MPKCAQTQALIYPYARPDRHIAYALTLLGSFCFFVILSTRLTKSRNECNSIQNVIHFSFIQISHIQFIIFSDEKKIPILSVDLKFFMKEVKM